MNATNATPCPPESLLADFGLGKLDAANAETVSQHLETCVDCRQRVAALSGDSFVDLLRQARGPVDADSRSPAPTMDEARVEEGGHGHACEATRGSPSGRAQNAGEAPAAFGRYQVLGLLGEGGSGVVYRGHDPELRREVAIKVPRRARAATNAEAEAYLAEARVLAALDHPRIVPVYDFGRTDDGLCYVVSQYVPGGDLGGLLAQRRLSMDEAVELAARIAEALHHAHQQGLVHRDVKPGNILLDREGHPLVADFGLALTDESYGRGAGVSGTPAYMSPEQARGESHLVDARSDIYSLGVVFYEMLTGRRPYRLTKPREVLEEISSRDIRPPRQLDHTIPQELERICLKALAKRPADRYTTAFDLAEDLRRWQSRGEVTDSESSRLRAAGRRGGDGASSVKRLALRSRRFKVLIGCGGLLTVSVTATVAGLLLMVSVRPPVQVAQNIAQNRPQSKSPPLESRVGSKPHAAAAPEKARGEVPEPGPPPGDGGEGTAATPAAEAPTMRGRPLVQLPAPPAAEAPTMRGQAYSPPHPKSKASPEELEAVGKLLSSARAALANRDVSKAQDLIAEATSAATAPDTMADVSRVETLTSYVEMFWDAVRKTLPKIQLEALTINGTMMVVVEADADHLVVRAEGKNREYSWRKLPKDIAYYLANRWLAPDDPVRNLVLASFEIVDPKGDRVHAQSLLDAASAAKLNVAPLVSELQAAPAK